MEILRLDHVTLDIKDHRILDDISFGVAAGDIVGLAGPSGAGKSSLLRLLNLLRSPSAGTITYKHRPLDQYEPAQLRREVGYVLQKPYLFGGAVRDNLEYAYRVWRQKPDPQEISAYLERVNLPISILDKTKNEMSGGEQQRVALVRSLLAKPQVLLLDEVTASLDEANTLLLEQLIRTEWSARSITVLFISHQPAQLRRLAQSVLYLEAGRLGYWGPVGEFPQRQGGTIDE